MNVSSWIADLEHLHTSYLLLVILAGVVLAGAVLFRVGVIDLVLRTAGYGVRTSIRGGFETWEYLLGWASWERFLTIACGLLLAGGLLGGLSPAFKIICSILLLVMGSSACFAYMFIDLERNEVQRGYKALHNPLKGQAIADNLKLYGHQVRVPLLISATVATIGGFALLNQGLYETVGRGWYKVAEESSEPVYLDFLAFSITRVLGLMDILGVARSHHILGAESVQPAAWPASGLSAVFKLFFTAVLLHQIFASLRQGKMLAETIADFWSPHEPIHERARNALPAYGTVAIVPLLHSLRSVATLTKEQRDQLPLILETMGPSIIAALNRCLHDPHEHVRVIATSTLGRLHALDSAHLLVTLVRDSSAIVRQSAIEALGHLGRQPSGATRTTGAAPMRSGTSGRGLGRRMRWRRNVALTASKPVDPVELAVTTLESALEDGSTMVRTQAVAALGEMGPPATAVAPKLIAMSKEGDEGLRCQVARALGEIRGDVEATVAALVELLDDASPEVKATAARALGTLKKPAASALQALASLSQDREESVRKAAAEAVAEIGTLDQAAMEILVEGLASQDNVVRAQTAQALGTIGAAAEEAAPALVAAIEDENDRVRAEAVEALGKIGESAAAAAVPGLTRALEDEDNTVSARAAEALGQMGDSAGEAVPALVDSLSHLNPQVRCNAATALGNLGSAVVSVRRALELAARDEDSGVRGEAILALGKFGGPTQSAMRLVLSGLDDADPRVRTAAVTCAGRWGEASDAVLSRLESLLDDSNDQVKFEVTRVLPKLAGATPQVVAGLCRQLAEDDSAAVQSYAALALGKLGSAAGEAGKQLLRVAQTGEVRVREQAMRAIARIQPPEATEAFAVGLKDASVDVRVLASAGWVNAEIIPDEAVPDLMEALRDPEARVRANAAAAIARLNAIPAEAVTRLIDCASDRNDAVRLNAAAALNMAPPEAIAEVMEHLTVDAHPRVRLTAASFLLTNEPNNADAAAVLVGALADQAPRVRDEAHDVFEALGENGAMVLDALQKSDASKIESDKTPY
jgi:HEAT repeat protein